MTTVTPSDHGGPGASAPAPAGHASESPRVVVLTRPQARNAALAQRLREAGWCVHDMPAQQLEPLIPSPDLPRPAQADLVVFVSSYAAQAYFAQLQASSLGAHWPATVEVATPGQVSAQRLTQMGWPGLVRPVFFPGPTLSQDSRGLWQALRERGPLPARVLLVRGETGSPWLADQMRATGMQVHEHVAYRRLALTWPDAFMQTLQDYAQVDCPVVWVLSSAEAMRIVADTVTHAGLLSWWRQGSFVLTHPQLQCSLPDGVETVKICPPTDSDIFQTVQGEPVSRLLTPKGPRRYNHTMTTNMTAHESDPAAEVQPSLVDTLNEPPPSRRRAPWLAALVVLVLLVVALASALWLQRKQFTQAGAAMTAQVDQLSSQVAQAQQASQQALASVQSQSQQLATLATHAQDDRSQLNAIQQLLNRNGANADAVLLQNTARLVSIADQQLRLAGSLGNALVALQVAKAGLDTAHVPRFNVLGRALEADITRLQATQTVDVAGLSDQIERLISVSGSAPLLVPDSAVPHVAPIVSATQGSAAPVAEVSGSWWQRSWDSVRSWPRRVWFSFAGDVRHLVSIQRANDPDALLLAPDQTATLRLIVRQRLLTAQTALLNRQPQVWRDQLGHVVLALQKDFNPTSPQTQDALKLAQTLAQTPVVATMPSVADTQAALAALQSTQPDEASSGPSSTNSSSTPNSSSNAPSSTQTAPGSSSADTPAMPQTNPPAAPTANGQGQS